MVHVRKLLIAAPVAFGLLFAQGAQAQHHGGGGGGGGGYHGYSGHHGGGGGGALAGALAGVGVAAVLGGLIIASQPRPAPAPDYYAPPPGYYPAPGYYAPPGYWR